MIVRGELETRHHRDGENHTLLSSLEVRWSGAHFIIQVGFVTDFLSIPKVLRRLVTKGGRAKRAAVVHDYIYRANVDGWSRLSADEAFLAIMKEDGVGYVRRYALYWGVRSGGWASWQG